MSQLKGAIPERIREGLVGKGPRSPDPAEKREKLQLEVPFRSSRTVVGALFHILLLLVSYLFPSFLSI